MPIGPPGWTCQMCQEHECKFVSMVRALASAEAGFVVWLGPKLLRHVEGSASFHLHLSLLLPGGGFGGGGVGKGKVGGGVCLGGGGGWGMIEGQVLGRGSCVKVSGDGPIISSVPTSPSVSDSSRLSSTGSPTC